MVNRLASASSTGQRKPATAGTPREAMQAIPPIHIIVSNGNVTLTGVVANASDKNVAEIQAKSVPGVFSVKNDLQVESGK